MVSITEILCNPEPSAIHHKILLGELVGGSLCNHFQSGGENLTSLIHFRIKFEPLTRVSEIAQFRGAVSTETRSPLDSFCFFSRHLRE